MRKILVATKARGFLITLFKSEFKNFYFQFKEDQIYETNSKRKLLLAKLVKSNLADHLGVIQRISINNRENYDLAFSYNRFLKIQKGYVVCLENPYALVHYSTNRNKTLFGKLKLKKFMGDANLKSIICLSKACYNTLNNVYEIPNHIKKDQIYPLVEKNPMTNEENIRSKSNRTELECLYISSNFNLKGGRDILECFKRFKQQGINNIKLTIITQLTSLDDISNKDINENENITVYDFKFSKVDLNKIYNNSSIFLNPTRQDSFSLVVLEAMKSGNTILTSDLYALSEMVLEGYNGYLTAPKYRFFNYDNMPNEAVWNNREKTIYSNYVDDNIVDFLYKKLLFLNSNREELERLSLNSFDKATNGEFSEEYIKQKYDEVLGGI